MLDRVIDNIIAKINKEVITPQMSQIPLNYLLNCNIPESVKHFFDQEVEIWLREESDKFVSNERFNYEIPEVRVLIDKIFDVLKQTATFHINKFNQLLERAIKLEANYLLKPHQTLTQFLFKNSKVITTMEVYDMLKYFDKLNYYKDALTDYFNLKYLREISQNQFQELITNIDKQVFDADKLNKTLQTVKAIINFMNDGRDATDSISTNLLLKAFEDRNLEDYLQLVKMEHSNGAEELSFSQLEALLRTGQTASQRVASPTEVQELSVEEVEDIETIKPEIQVEEITVESEISEVTEETTELEEELEEEEEEEEEVVAAAPAEVPVETPTKEKTEILEEETEEPSSVEEPQEETATAADQLADVVSEKIKGKYLPDLNEVISSKYQKKFIKKIFKKDERRFIKFINYLNQLTSWKKASAAIDEMFYQTGVNPYSSIAIEFSDMIYNRYFPKDKMLERQHFM
jgi:hypothetical protein